MVFDSSNAMILHANEDGGAMATVLKGSKVIQALAKQFPQLYVAPSEDAAEANRLARLRGFVSPDANLDHFTTGENNEYREVDTPAGPVMVVFLKERADFETFLQIIGNQSQPVPIARTIGAITYRGLADWKRVAQARDEYLAAGGDNWPEHFAQLAKRPGAFRTELVAISEGPYSNVASEETPFSKKDWLAVSREIRLHHECAHVVCRRLMPDNILPIWDEITADLCGLLCATGRYDAQLAARFLGVTEDGFASGRLSEYLNEEQLARIDEISIEVINAIKRIENRCQAGWSSPFDLVLELKREPYLTY